MVRRRGFVRAAEYLSDDRKEQPRREEHSGDGAMVAWAMGARGRREPGRHSFRLEDLGLVSRKRRASLLQFLPERQGRVETAGSDDFRRWRERVEILRSMAAEKLTIALAILPRKGQVGVRRSSEPRASWRGVRRIPERPRQSSALYESDHEFAGDRLYDRRPTLRRAPSGRAGL